MHERAFDPKAPSADENVHSEALHAMRKAHEWLERVEQLRQPGSHFGLDHKIGENDDGCSLCHAVAAIEGRVEPLTEGDY